MSVISRPLTTGEWDSLSAGLATALRRAGARPRLRDAVHLGARVAGFLRRTPPPILTRGDVIWWPAPPTDISRPGLETAMATLQHELQHVLDYRIGWLTAVRYLAHPRHWTYDWTMATDTAWERLGAEQRAAMAETLWLWENGLGGPGDLAALRRIVPWAAIGSTTKNPAPS